LTKTKQYKNYYYAVSKALFFGMGLLDFSYSIFRTRIVMLTHYLDLERGRAKEKKKKKKRKFHSITTTEKSKMAM